MQETFTQLWRRPQGFDAERGSLRGYLFGMGRKLAMEWWRREKPTEELKEEAGACRGETTAMVAEAFGQLNEEQRTLLWLREVEGQSYAELAVILEVPVGTVRSRLFAAREALRAVWLRERVEKEGLHEVR
jgi:RNA polymerase sigma-70 factor (ECF subfamily)